MMKIMPNIYQRENKGMWSTESKSQNNLSHFFFAIFVGFYGDEVVVFDQHHSTLFIRFHTFYIYFLFSISL